jgi:hypothetical protein
MAESADATLAGRGARVGAAAIAARVSLDPVRGELQPETTADTAAANAIA